MTLLLLLAGAESAASPLVANSDNVINVQFRDRRSMVEFRDKRMPVLHRDKRESVEADGNKTNVPFRDKRKEGR